MVAQIEDSRFEVVRLEVHRFLIVRFEDSQFEVDQYGLTEYLIHCNFAGIKKAMMPTGKGLRFHNGDPKAAMLQQTAGQVHALVIAACIIQDR